MGVELPIQPPTHRTHGQPIQIRVVGGVSNIGSDGVDFGTGTDFSCSLFGQKLAQNLVFGVPSVEWQGQGGGRRGALVDSNRGRNGTR